MHAPYERTLLITRIMDLKKYIGLLEARGANKLNWTRIGATRDIDCGTHAAAVETRITVRNPN